MPYNNGWPYTDVHQLNLDWIVDTVKDIKDKTDEIDAAVETSAGNANAALESANDAAQSALNAESTLDTFRTELNQWESEYPDLSDQVQANTADIAVNSARIDSIISGTTPDANAELIDIRVAYNGKTYATAGEAVRSQVEELDNNYDVSDNVLSLTNILTSGYVNTGGTVTADGNCRYSSLSITNDMINVPIYVTGVAWWNVKPWVFVGNSTSYADVPNPGNTVTNYEDLLFIPTETGILYINTHQSVNITRAVNKEYKYLKNASLPIRTEVKAAIKYDIISLSILNNKWVNADTGVITDLTGNEKVSDYIDVENYEKVMLTTQSYFTHGLYAFYDKNHVFISGRKSNAGATVTRIYNEIVTVPANAKYLVIGYLYDLTMGQPFAFSGISQIITNGENWNSYKWACVGDSLTALSDRTAARYYDFIRGTTGINVVNLAVGGTGYAKGSANFMNTVLNVPADSDVVTIFGSGNDMSAGLPLGSVNDTGTATLAGCINTTIDNLYTVNPVIQLGIITPTPWVNNMPFDNTLMEEYAELIVNICKARSIPCLDLYHCSNLNPNNAAVRTIAYSRDDGNGVHPNEVGHKLIASRIKSFLESLII